MPLSNGDFSGYISFLLSSKISWDILIVHHIYSNSNTILQKNTNWPPACVELGFSAMPKILHLEPMPLPHTSPIRRKIGRDVPTFRTRCLSRIWAHHLDLLLMGKRTPASENHLGCFWNLVNNGINNLSIGAENASINSITKRAMKPRDAKNLGKVLSLKMGRILAPLIPATNQAKLLGL